MWLKSQKQGWKPAENASYLLPEMGPGHWFPMQMQAWERKDLARPDAGLLGVLISKVS